MNEQQPPPAPGPDARPGMSYACEACRAAKVKCVGSVQQGICKRCLDSRRECIFKTGPRTRRRRQTKATSQPSTYSSTSQPDHSHSQPQAQLPPLPGPSKTFTIDTPLLPQDDLPSNFEFLRSTHQNILDALLPTDPSAPIDHTPIMDTLRGTPSLASVSTPPSTTSLSASPRPISTLAIQPQFNLDSAAQLLRTFKSQMLPNFPCLLLTEAGSDTFALPPNPSKSLLKAREEFLKTQARAAVVGMSRTRPFVLLAILAAASGSRTLQGHSLYDEEFRKVLGLKFVAGGERGLELLVGLLVYCTWYPAHLRPKSRQVQQYVRMAADIVQDLELDQAPDEEDEEDSEGLSEERLEGMRAYLATYYLTSNRSAHWFAPKIMKPTPWLTRCCDLLEQHPACDGDRVLPWLVRHQTLIEQAADLAKNTKRPDEDDLHRAELMERGVNAQLAEWKACIPADIAQTTPLALITIFTHLFTATAPLLNLMPPSRTPKRRHTPNPLHSSSVFPAPHHIPALVARMNTIIPLLHTCLNAILALPASTLMAFSCMQWAQFVVGIVVAFRITFPPPPIPPPTAAQRERVAFEPYLARLCRLGIEGQGVEESPASKRGMDVLSAVRVVLGEVRGKYERRIAAEMEAAGVAAAMEREMEVVVERDMAGCPMLDGSVEHYFGVWDETFSDPMAAGKMGEGSGDGFEDIWATMTGEWAQEGMDLAGFGEM